MTVPPSSGPEGQPDPYAPQMQPGYGQQPGQPNPYGEPPAQPGQYGQPGPYGQAPIGYGPPPMPLPRKKRRLWLKIGLPILIVLLVGVGSLVYFGYKSTALSSGVGDCLQVKDFSAQLTSETFPAKADCGDPAANVKIALKLDGSAPCPGDQIYDEFTLQTPSTRFCLMLNAKQGDCLSIPDQKNYSKVPCTDPKATVTVGKVVAGRADAKLCDIPESAIAYPEPATTFCFAPVPK
jgi:hypothetical protein